MDSHPPSHALHALARKADRMVLIVLAVGALAAMVLGAIYGPMVSGSSIALGLLAAGLLAWRLAAGTLFSRLTLAVLGMLMVSLHIQLARGWTELHFGVFVFLAFLLVYRDWRPIVLAAATIAIHHLAFDRLQALGWPVFCMSEPHFGQVLVHAAFVVIQTLVEVVMAVRMRADALEAQELHTLCQPTAQGQLNLDVQQVQVASASAIAVRAAFVQLDHLVTEARTTADLVQQSSAHIAQHCQHLQQHSQTTAQQLQTTAAHMQTIHGSALTCAATSGQASTIAGAATHNAQSCGSLVTEVVGAMAAIHDSARQIGDIVGLIDSIAFQTNILALNAAVEAARAGEHGRGFAVVATEVRNLAQRSASAAKEVRNLIQTSLHHAAQGSNVVQSAGSSMQTVVTHTTHMAEVIEQLRSLADTQAITLEQATSAVHHLKTLTLENTALTTQSTQSALSLLEQATKLQAVVAGVRSATPHHFAGADLARTVAQPVQTQTAHPDAWDLQVSF